MTRICFRLAIARPGVGFDYFGSWTAYNPVPVLNDSRRILAKDPQTALRLQSDDGRGNQVDLGWDPQWLILLEMQHNCEMQPEQWNRFATSMLLGK